jgi:hypothetical protein
MRVMMSLAQHITVVQFGFADCRRHTSGDTGQPDGHRRLPGKEAPMLSIENLSSGYTAVNVIVR